MIETNNTFGTTTIYCDDCDEEQEFDGFDGHIDFHKAIEEAKEYGWKITKDNDGDWVHYCHECAKIR